VHLVKVKVAQLLTQGILEDNFMINWIPLTTTNAVDEVKQASFSKPQIIFKHSTTCSISNMAYSRLQRATELPKNADFLYVDLLQYRSVSNAVAQVFDVHHESPQVLIISKGECIYDESHYGITMDEILDQAKAL
jgi:bacillithiol system protein YtxJ